MNMLTDCLETYDDYNSLIKPTGYFDMTQFGNHMKSLNGPNISIFNTNSRSLVKNHSQYEILFESLKHSHDFEFDIISFDETWLNSELQKLTDFEGYTPIYKHKTRIKEGGGIAIFVKQNIKFHVRDDLSVPLEKQNMFDCLFIEIVTSEFPIIIGTVYRSPSSNSTRELSQFITEVAEKTNFDNKQIILLGDFNINLLNINSNSNTSDFLDSMMSVNLIPCVTMPTRVTANSATLIDHIYSTIDSDCLSSGTIVIDITDHYANFITVQTANTQNNTKQTHVTYRPFNHTNIQKFNEALQTADWSNVYLSEDSNQAYNTFIKIYTQHLDQNIPIKTVRYNKYKHKSHPWITKRLLKSLKTKELLHSKLKTYRNETVYQEKEAQYKKYRNLYNRLIRLSKIRYWHDRFENSKHSIKETWLNINNILNRTKTKHNFPDYFIENNIKITCREDIAKGFNKYFVNIGPELAKKINPDMNSVNPISIDLPNSFSFSPVTPVEIINITQNLKPKTSKGHDDISPKLVKENSSHIASPLAHIANLSFSTGIFPNDLKIAKIIPIYKNNDNTNFSNYRPISLLPTFSKIIERLAYNRLYKYLKQNNILTPSQYGFQKGLSTDLALLEFQNHVVTNLSNNKYCIGIFIDLSKAFDTLDHLILLNKLNQYGIRGIANNWFNSYLSNRYQYTEFMSVSSNLSKIECGVPQGSILGPLLFLLYLNDITMYCNNSTPILFADDTNLLFYDKDLNNLESKINSELKTLSSWFSHNKLSLNADKTKFILFDPHHPNTHPNISIIMNNKQLERVNHSKFLGVFVDHKLNWNFDINNRCNQISKNLAMITRLKNSIPTYIIKILYQTLIVPYLHYGIAAWGNVNMNSKAIKRLTILQKRAIRTICKAKYNSHTNPLFKQEKV